MAINPDSRPRMGLKDAAVYWTGFAGEHYSGISRFGTLRRRVEQALIARQLPESGTVPIEKLDPAGLDPDWFRRAYVQPNIPVVLRGLGAHWPALEKWTPEFFKARYGQERIVVRVESDGVGAESVYTRDVSIAELIDNILSGGKFYANNLEDLFNHHPELRADLNLRALERFSCAHPPAESRGGKNRWRFPRWGEIMSTQIFLSNGKGRTGYHCALAGNFFLQVKGRKKWTFVNPRHTAFMYPAIRKDFFYSVSPVDARMSAAEVAQSGYELYNRVPKYEVVLEPGDVLYSPQWWWHTVDNLDVSIGVALRFRTDLFASNPVYSAMTLMSPGLLKHVFNVVRTGWGADGTAARTFFEPEGSDAKIPLPRTQGRAAGR